MPDDTIELTDAEGNTWNFSRTMAAMIGPFKKGSGECLPAIQLRSPPSETRLTIDATALAHAHNIDALAAQVGSDVPVGAIIVGKELLRLDAALKNTAAPQPSPASLPAPPSQEGVVRGSVAAAAVPSANAAPVVWMRDKGNGLVRFIDREPLPQVDGSGWVPLYTQSPEAATLERPVDGDAAKERIDALVREVEILCDEFGYDPAEWLQPQERAPNRPCPRCGVNEGEVCQDFDEQAKVCNHRKALRPTKAEK